MAKSTRRRSQQKIALMTQGIIWGAGLFGGCLLGGVVLVLPWGAVKPPTSSQTSSPIVEVAIVHDPVADLSTRSSLKISDSTSAKQPQRKRPGDIDPSPIPTLEIASAAAKTNPKRTSSNPIRKTASRRTDSARLTEKASTTARNGKHRPKIAENPRSSIAARPLNNGAATLAYWNEINSIIEQEEKLRSVPLGGLTAANAKDFLSRRSDSGEFAFRALSELDPKGVDAEVLSLSKSLRDWYERESKNAKEGENLLTKGDEKSRKGSPGKQWKSSELEHGKAVETINRTGAALRKKLIQKYKLNFPLLR